MKDLFTEIWASVKRNKLRTCLTGLAVSWGIFMLIVLLGAGNGVLNSFTSDMDGMERNVMSVYGGRTSKPYDGLKEGRWVQLKEQDVEITGGEAFKDNIDKVSSVIYQGSLVMSSGKRHLNISAMGVYPMYEGIHYVDMEAGRFINDLDISQRRKVAVITHLQAKNLLGGKADYEKALGARVKVDGISYTVIGIRHGHENNDDRDVLFPFTTMKALYKSGDLYIGQIEFSFHGLETIEDNEKFEKNYRAVLNKAHRAAPDDESALWIQNRFRSDMQMNNAMNILKTSLWVLGLLTLLGGIVGVSNIMLITVKERTHEFGIRKAIGAKPWSIMKLIVAESVSITALFGYIGMMLGLVACEILNATVGQSSVSVFGESVQVMKDPSVGIGTALGVTVVLIIAGTLAGMVPAMKAAKVKPIEALMAD